MSYDFSIGNSHRNMKNTQIRQIGSRLAVATVVMLSQASCNYHPSGLNEAILTPIAVVAIGAIANNVSFGSTYSGPTEKNPSESSSDLDVCFMATTRSENGREWDDWPALSLWFEEAQSRRLTLDTCSQLLADG